MGAQVFRPILQSIQTVIGRNAGPAHVCTEDKGLGCSSAPSFPRVRLSEIVCPQCSNFSSLLCMFCLNCSALLPRKQPATFRLVAWLYRSSNVSSAYPSISDRNSDPIIICHISVRTRMKATGNVAKLTGVMKLVASSKLKGVEDALENGKAFGVRPFTPHLIVLTAVAVELVE